MMTLDQLVILESLSKKQYTLTGQIRRRPRTTWQSYNLGLKLNLLDALNDRDDRIRKIALSVAYDYFDIDVLILMGKIWPDDDLDSQVWCYYSQPCFSNCEPIYFDKKYYESGHC